MNNEIQQPVFTTKYRRKPWIALTLSIISPGLGHVYNGLLGKAILYKLCMYIFFIIANLAGFLDKFWEAVIVYLIIRLFHIYLVIDSFLVSKRIHNFVPKAYTSVIVYTVFVFVSYIATNIVEYRLPPTRPSIMMSKSMTPTIFTSDKLMTNRGYYRTHKIQHSDVVIYKSPLDNKKSWMHRVIGMPGDSILCDHDTIYLNGNRLYEPYVKYDSTTGSKEYINLKSNVFLVPKDSLFILGDNRGFADDSRMRGFIPISDIRGKVLYIYFSKNLKKIGKNI